MIIFVHFTELCTYINISIEPRPLLLVEGDAYRHLTFWTKTSAYSWTFGTVCVPIMVLLFYITRSFACARIFNYEYFVVAIRLSGRLVSFRWTRRIDCRGDDEGSVEQNESLFAIRQVLSG